MNDPNDSKGRDSPAPMTTVVAYSLLVANVIAFLSIGYFAIRIDAYTDTWPIIRLGLFCASILAILSCWVSVERKSRMASAIGLTIVGNVAIYVAFWTPLILYEDLRDTMATWAPSLQFAVFPVALTAMAVVAAFVWKTIAARRRRGRGFA